MQEKCSCSKEPIGTIPIMRVIDKIDEMFEKDDLQGAKRVLEYWEQEAKALGDTKGLLEILSEQIGLYRKLGEKKRDLKQWTKPLRFWRAKEARKASTTQRYTSTAQPL